MGNFDNYYIDENGKAHRDIPLGTSPADAYVRTNMKLKKEVQRIDGAMQEVSEHIDAEISRVDEAVVNTADEASRQLENVVNDMNNNISEVSESINTRISSEISTVNSRVDNIITHNNDTEGNSELVDIRTGTDHLTYASAGGAVRNQIAGLRKQAFTTDYLGHNQNCRCVLSFINSSISGGEILHNNSSNRACTEDLLYVPNGCFAIINVTANYRFSYYLFDENSVFQNSGFNFVSKVLSSGFYRFLVTKTDNSDLTSEEAANAISVQMFRKDSSVFDLHNENLLLDHTTSVVQGKFISNQGNEDGSSVFNHTGIIALHNIGHLYVRGNLFCRPSVMSNIAFYSRPIISSQFFVSAWNPSDTDQTAGIYLGLTEVPIPENAEYMYICSHDNFSDFELYAVPKHQTFQSIASVMKKVVLCDTAKPKIKIKLIGDSITHGFGGTGYTNDAEHGGLIYTDGDRSWYVNSGGVCWANMLKNYLEGKYHCTVKNYGTSGRASGHLRMYLDQLIDNDDSIIICMIGTNDRNNESDPYSGNRRNLTQTLENMQAIHDYCTALGKDIIFMSSIPASVQNENSNKICHMEDIDNVIMKLAAQNNMEYISVYKKFLEYCQNTGVTIDSLLSDGLHPNDSGYGVMFEIIAKALGFGIKRSGADW